MRQHDDPDWLADAACSTTDPEVFTSPFGPRGISQAKALCASCTVQANCLEFAIAGDERHGVWGGMTRQERDRLRVTRAQSWA